MMEWLYRQIYGYVEVTLSGKNIERCMNICAKNEIIFWNVRVESPTRICACCSIQDFKRCKPALRKTRSTMRIAKKHGSPFVVFRYRKRVIFPIAFVLICGILVYYSQFIWKIEIQGNSLLSEEKMIAYLTETSASFGTPKKEIDCNALELQLRTDFQEIIWSSVYMEGTKLVVELQENMNNQTMVNTRSDECYDLTATKDAQISTMITRAGTPLVAEGQEVKAGDILVSGRQEITNDNGEVGQYFYQSADADVYGIVWYSYSETIPVSQEQKILTGQEQTRYSLRVKDYRLDQPLFDCKFAHYYRLDRFDQFHLTDNFYLPVYFGREVYQEYQIQQVEYSKEEAKALATANFSKFIEDLEENGVQIISKNVIMVRKENQYIVTGEVKACESIAQPTLTERLEIQKEGTDPDEHE